MYDVLDVCRYVINYCNDKNYDISNLKLQKLLYFIQAYFLISDEGKPCFKESIEAWTFGPVVPEAYREYKICGYSNIPRIHRCTEVSSTHGNFHVYSKPYDPEVLSPKSREMIDDVIENFKQYTAPDLVNLTHLQKPWRDAYAQGKNTVISNQSIKDYFDVKE